MELQPLDFEKPILELERRLQDLKTHSREHDVDLDSEVEAIEGKLRDTRRQVYGNLSAWQRVQIARHVQRPFALDYIERCFTGWTELHGDRHFADDKAMPSAPPDPPSPITAAITGTRKVIISRKFTAIASEMCRSSEPIPGKAPGVSINEMTGIPNFSASCIRRNALR